MEKFFDRAVVHIGFPKTGTSTVQSALNRNREILERDFGVYYPKFDRVVAAPLSLLFSEDRGSRFFARVFGSASREERRHIIDSFAQNLNHEFSETKARTVLISAESLQGLRDNGVERFKVWLEGYANNVSIVACLRHPYSIIHSDLQQKLKVGHILEDLVETVVPISFENSLGAWLKVFGRSSVSIYSFEEAVKHDHGLFGFFCDVSNIDRRFYEGLAPERQNESLSQGGADLLNRLNRLRPLFEGQRLGSGRVYSDASPFREIGGGKFRVDEDVAEKTIDDRQLAWLKDEFGFEFPPMQLGDGAPGGQDPWRSDDVKDSIALLIADLHRVATFDNKYLKGRLRFLEENYDAAEREFRKLIKINPNSRKAHYMLAKTLRRLGRVEDAKGISIRAKDLARGS